MANYQYLTATGVIVTDTSDILAAIQAEYRAAFGADLVVTADTPQGVLITAEALARTEVINNNAALANQINPNIAGGVFLDAIMALTGVQRTAATPTVVTNVTLTGVAGTIIAEGAQAKTSAGDIFGTVSQVTLDVSGNGQVDFQSTEEGAIPCAAHELNIIVTAVLGWETVDNSPDSAPASATTLGAITQSDQSARAYRNNTLAFQGVALAEAITSALYNVPGVQSLFFQENVSNSTQTINGISMISHSVYACVNGGTNTDVAAALLENKSSGAAWNGGTTVNVIEPASGQTYAVKFDRPTPVGILVKVTSPNGNEADIIQAVLDYMNGLVSITNQNGTQQTLPGFVVGADVSPFEISSAIVAENPGIYIEKLELGLYPSGPYSTDAIVIGVNEIGYTQQSYVSVVVP